MQVEVVDWSYGAGRVFADLHGHCRHCERGKELAGKVLALRARCPQARICLVGHSAGAAVVLAATAELPLGSVDRIVLLGPALSATCDLSPALRASREGIDSFHSHRDGLCVGLGLAGTADGRFFCSVAGWGGFEVPEDCASPGLYAGLRQHANCYTGHYTSVTPAFVRCCVVPLLLAGAAPGGR
jgi:pimeloyl-ACP methyl ester carboxylesterase